MVDRFSLEEIGVAPLSKQRGFRCGRSHGKVPFAVPDFLPGEVNALLFRVLILNTYETTRGRLFSDVARQQGIGDRVVRGSDQFCHLRRTGRRG